MSGTAIVVGSGVSGLVAAMILADAGRQVLVLERCSRPAPLISGITVDGGVCETGFHYTSGFQRNGLLHHLCNRFDVMSDLTLESIPQEGIDVLRWSGTETEILVPVGLENVRSALVSAFPGSEQAVDAYMQAVEKLLEETPLLNPEVPPWLMTEDEHKNRSLADFLLRNGAPADLVHVLGGYGQGLYGTNTAETPFSVHGMVLGSYYVSAHRVVGGGRALANALLNGAGKQGVEVRCRSGVERILLSPEGEVSGVGLDTGERLRADTVVYTPHPATILGTIPENGLGRKLVGRIRTAHDTDPFFVTFVEFGDETDSRGRNYYTFSRPESGEGGTPFRESLSTAVMAGSPDAAGRYGPRSVIQPMAPLANGSGGEGGNSKERCIARAVRAVRSFVPELGERLSVVASASPGSYRSWTGTVGGSAYGLKHTVNGPSISTVTPIKGLYLAGQSVLLPGVMGAAASSILACGHILGFGRLWKSLFR